MKKRIFMACIAMAATCSIILPVAFNDINFGYINAGNGEKSCADATFGTTEYTSSNKPTNTDISAANAVIKSVSCSNVYGVKGSSFRIGSGSNPGTLVLNFETPMVITKIKVLAYKYGGDSSKSQELTCFSENSSQKTLPVSATTAPDITDSSADTGLVFDSLDGGNGVASSSLTIKGTKGQGRVNLCKIVFTINGYSDPVVSSSSSSSLVSSSSSSSSSSTSTPSSSTISTSTSLPEDINKYYSGIDFSNKGAALKSSLYNLIKGHKDNGYDFAYTAYKTTDVDENGKIIDVYSSYKWSPSDHNGNYNAEGQIFNREHMIPQSVFSKRAPMKADLHHLFPTDGYVNNRRSNFPHGYISGTANYTSTNGSKQGTSDSSRNFGLSGPAFEPIDEYKGDIARTYFYMATRYENVISSWKSFEVFNNTSFPTLSTWSRKLYLQWSDQDPVSPKEIKRNNGVQSFQGNRNPFIDHPEAAHLIWD